VAPVQFNSPVAARAANDPTSVTFRHSTDKVEAHLSPTSVSTMKARIKGSALVQPVTSISSSACHVLVALAILLPVSTACPGAPI